MHRSLTALFFLTALFSVAAELPPRPTPSIRQVEGSPLAYTPDGAGNTVIDFSHAGYAGGGEAIPFVSAKFTVAPSSLSAPNDRARIQAALDAVATLPVGPDGFRGAVLLAPGRYTIDGTLRLNASGVVLRGSGQGANENDPTATVLVSTRPRFRISCLLLGRRTRRTRPHRRSRDLHRRLARLSNRRTSLSHYADRRWKKRHPHSVRQWHRRRQTAVGRLVDAPSLAFTPESRRAFHVTALSQPPLRRVANRAPSRVLGTRP